MVSSWTESRSLYQPKKIGKPIELVPDGCTVGRAHICKLSRYTNTKLVHPFRGKSPNVSTLQIKLFKEPVTIILIITPDFNTKRNKKAFIVYFTNFGTSIYIP